MGEFSEPLDVIIVGGGPAGISSAMWCADLVLSTLLIEREAELGGQLLHIYGRIANYPGITTKDGRELRDRFRASLDSFTAVKRLRSIVSEIDVAKPGVILESGELITANVVIVATGVRRRKLGVAGENEFAGKGIIESGTKERDSVAGKSVLIVGGGDAALENALILAEVADKVTVANRSVNFRARDEFLAPASSHPRITLMGNTMVERFEGNTSLESATLKNTATGETRHISIEAALIRIGVTPNSELLKGKLLLDRNGYVLAGANGETNVPGIFAVGDISNPTSLTIATAVGTGSTAAKTIRNWLNSKSGVYSKRLRIPNI